MNKKELNEIIRQGDKQIEKIKEEQLQLISNYIKEKYQIEKKDILLYNGMRIVVVGFEVEGNTHNIKIRYRRLKYNDALDNITYKLPIQYKLEKIGTYKQKINGE